jgi:hypothetical protein
MSNNLVDFEHLQQYTSLVKKEISNAVNQKTDVGHSHVVNSITFTPNKRTTTDWDINRLASYRNCDIKERVSGDCHLDSDTYDMFYITLTGSVNLIIDHHPLDTEEVDKKLTAREIKIIIQTNGENVSWDWPSNPSNARRRILWMNGETPTYTSGVDVIDLFTVDGDDWFAYIMKNF